MTARIRDFLSRRTEDGPCLVEGNGKPDVDILQRQYRQGLGETRFGRLLAHHVANRLAGDPLNGRMPSEVYARIDLPGDSVAAQPTLFGGAALTGSGSPR